MHRSGQEPILTIGNDFGDLPMGHQITRKGAGTLENMVMSEMAKQSLRGDKKGLLGGEVRGLVCHLLPRPSQHQVCFSFFGLRSSCSFIATQHRSRGPMALSWARCCGRAGGEEPWEAWVCPRTGWVRAQCGGRQGGRGTGGNSIPGAPLTRGSHSLPLPLLGQVLPREGPVSAPQG